jgi:hypothetical protein
MQRKGEDVWIVIYYLLKMLFDENKFIVTKSDKLSYSCTFKIDVEMYQENCRFLSWNSIINLCKYA